MSTCDGHTAGLKKDGTVIAVGANQHNQCDTSSWSDIVSVDTHSLYYTLGLKADGTIVYTGDRGALEDGYTQIQQVSSWKDIVAINIISNTVFGIKMDGTVVTANITNKIGANGYHYGLDEGLFKDWADIIAVSGYGKHIVGLKADGTVIKTKNSDCQCDVSKWSDIISVAAGGSLVIGLKADGTVVSTGLLRGEPIDVSGWSDIEAIALVLRAAVGVKKDGSVVFSGDLGNFTAIKNWNNVKIPIQTH